MNEEIKKMAEEIVKEISKRLDDLYGCCQFDLHTEEVKREQAEKLMRLIGG